VKTPPVVPGMQGHWGMDRQWRLSHSASSETSLLARLRKPSSAAFGSAAYLGSGKRDSGQTVRGTHSSFVAMDRRDYLTIMRDYVGAHRAGGRDMGASHL